MTVSSGSSHHGRAVRSWSARLRASTRRMGRAMRCLERRATLAVRPRMERRARSAQRRRAGRARTPQPRWARFLDRSAVLAPARDLVSSRSRRCPGAARRTASAFADPRVGSSEVAVRRGREVLVPASPPVLSVGACRQASTMPDAWAVAPEVRLHPMKTCAHRTRHPRVRRQSVADVHRAAARGVTRHGAG